MKNNTNDNYFTKASFTNYTNKVIKNSSINFKKKKRKLEETEVEYDNQIIEDMSFSHNKYISFFDDFEKDYQYDQLENYISNTELHNIIKNLSNFQKQILYYKYIKDYDYDQIALIMKKSESNIRNMRSRIIKKIKNNLKGVK